MFLLRCHQLPRQPCCDRPPTAIVRVSNGCNERKLCDDNVDVLSALRRECVRLCGEQRTVFARVQSSGVLGAAPLECPSLHLLIKAATSSFTA